MHGYADLNLREKWLGTPGRFSSSPSVEILFHLQIRRQSNGIQFLLVCKAASVKMGFLGLFRDKFSIIPQTKLGIELAKWGQHLIGMIILSAIPEQWNINLKSWKQSKLRLQLHYTRLISSEWSDFHIEKGFELQYAAQSDAQYPDWRSENHSALEEIRKSLRSLVITRIRYAPLWNFLLK